MIKINFFLSLLMCVVFHFSNGNDAITLFPSLPIAAITSENNACKRDSNFYVEELKKKEMWALRMWDATTKSYEGILNGNTYQMGDFHECINTQAPFTTQYCLTTIILHFDSSFQNKFTYPNNNNYSTVLERFTAPPKRWREPKNYIKVAWCIPASCSINDLKNVLMAHLKSANTSLSSYGATYTVGLSSEDCQVYEPWSMDTADITFFILSAFLITFVTFATIYDFYTERTGCNLFEKSKRIITAFSAKKNFTDLSCAANSDALDVLHGIRTVSCFAIIIIHRFTIVAGVGTYKNFDYLEDAYVGQEPLKIIFYHPDILVDTFFTLSGILTAYLIFKSAEKKTIQPLKIIFLRYMRLTPVYAYVVFYYTTLYNSTGSGPLWEQYITSQQEYCRENWYLNLLYIHNYFKSETMCMSHTWSLACDFHFFIIGLFICHIIIYKKRAGFTLLSILTILSIMWTFFKIYFEERTAFLLFYPNLINDPDFQEMYIKSHLRATPYFIGLYVGYFYSKHYNPKKRMNLIQSAIICITSLAILLAVVLSAGIFYDRSREYNALEAATYGALNRVIWSIGLIGVIFVATNGSFPFLREVLSWKLWIPFAKLTYAVFIIHFQFQMRNVVMATYPIDFSFSNMLLQGVSDCVNAFVVGLVLYIIVEVPLRKMINLLLIKNVGSSSKKKLS